MEPSQQNGEETPEDVLEQLAHMERLVVQLKDLVREKDAQLQQKEAVLQVPLLCAEGKVPLLLFIFLAWASLVTRLGRIQEVAKQSTCPGTVPWPTSALLGLTTWQ